MNYFDAVDFSECHSEEVMFLLTLSLYMHRLHVPEVKSGHCFCVHNVNI